MRSCVSTPGRTAARSSSGCDGLTAGRLGQSRNSDRFDVTVPGVERPRAAVLLAPAGANRTWRRMGGSSTRTRPRSVRISTYGAGGGGRAPGAGLPADRRRAVDPGGAPCWIVSRYQGRDKLLLRRCRITSLDVLDIFVPSLNLHDGKDERSLFVHILRSADVRCVDPQRRGRGAGSRSRPLKPDSSR